MAPIDDTAPTDARERTTVAPTRRVDDDYDGYDDQDGYDEDRNEGTPRSYAVVAVLVVVVLVLVALLFLVTRGLDSGGDEATRGAADVTVPRVIGMPQADAEAALDQANLVPTVETAVNDTVATGTVVDQNPAANEPVATGSEVTITVSAGPGTIAVPDVEGKTQDEAIEIVTDLGLVPSPRQVESPTVAEGLVIDTNPQAGTPTTRGATIEIQVSATPRTAVVPDVTGQPEAEARAALERAGFEVTISEQPTHRRRRDGRVLGQNPTGGTSSPIGSQVEIVIGRSQDRDSDRDND
jgi:serine/threonine-protein kinase